MFSNHVPQGLQVVKDVVQDQTLFEAAYFSDEDGNIISMNSF